MYLTKDSRMPISQSALENTVYASYRFHHWSLINLLGKYSAQGTVPVWWVDEKCLCTKDVYMPKYVRNFPEEQTFHPLCSCGFMEEHCRYFLWCCPTRPVLNSRPGPLSFKVWYHLKSCSYSHIWPIQFFCYA